MILDALFVTGALAAPRRRAGRTLRRLVDPLLTAAAVAAVIAVAGWYVIAGAG